MADRKDFVAGNTGVIAGEVVCSSDTAPGYEGELSEVCMSWQFPDKEVTVICVPMYGKSYYKGKSNKAKAAEHKANQEAGMPPGAHILDGSRGDNNKEVASRLKTAVGKAVGATMTEAQAASITVETAKKTTEAGAGGAASGRQAKGLETRTFHYFRVLIPGATNVDGAAYGDQGSKFGLTGYAPGKKAAALGVGAPPPYGDPIPFKDKWRKNADWYGPKKRGFGKKNPCEGSGDASDIRLNRYEKLNTDNTRNLAAPETQGWEKV